MDYTTIIVAAIGAFSLIIAAIITNIGTITAARISRNIMEASKTSGVARETVVEKSASNASLITLLIISILIVAYNLFRISGYYFSDVEVTPRTVLGITFSVFSFTMFLLLAAFSSGMLRARKRN